MEYTTPHKLITGTATVRGQRDSEFHVDLDAGTCSCANGEALYWADHKQAWLINRWCTHKLRALASIIDRTPEPAKQELTTIYWKTLSQRYIVWEAVSAFHKELRRGDTEKARYWAVIVAGHRGVHGVVRYLLNIMFEETRDIPLYKYIMALCERGQIIPMADMLNAVERFTLAPKKWQLPHRYPIFVDEMRGYKDLIIAYSADVAKPKEIIPEGETVKLQGSILVGYASKDRKQLQFGLKGLFKKQAKIDHEKHKIRIFNFLTDILNGEHENNFKHDHTYALELQRLHMRRIRSFGLIGYHELNSFADALAGEKPAENATLAPHLHRAIISRPRPAMPPLGVFHNVPIYAQDNHTYRGKALMKKYGEVELQAGAVQEHLDFRMCGAYFGVAWRTLAWDQFGTCEVEFDKVKWNKPTWLWGHVNSMWY